MNETDEIRWVQRYSNYRKALKQIQSFPDFDDLNIFEKQGLVQAFEYTYELAWKTLQDFLHSIGFEDVIGPKPVIKTAFQQGIISKGEIWMKMHKSRNLASHTYEEEIANEICINIKKQYIDRFEDLDKRLKYEKNELEK